VFAESLRAVEDMHLEGALTTRYDALAHVRATWPQAARGL
jgi:hypothetical protein